MEQIKAKIIKHLWKEFEVLNTKRLRLLLLKRFVGLIIPLGSSIRKLDEQLDRIELEIAHEYGYDLHKKKVNKLIKDCNSLIERTEKELEQKHYGTNKNL